MAFCRKCGAIMAGFETACGRCGAPVDSSDIGGKNELIRTLEKYRTLLSECEELKTMMKPQSDFPMSESTDFKKRSFIRYFWPFLIAAPVAFYVIYLASTFIIMYSAIDTISTTGRNVSEASLYGDTMLGMVIALIVAAVIIFFGVKTSKRKQADFNSNADFMNRQASERYQKGLQNQKMINLYQSNIQEMHKYETMVPEKHRNSADVGSIIQILKEDRAQTVDEAVALL